MYFFPKTGEERVPAEQKQYAWTCTQMQFCILFIGEIWPIISMFSSCLDKYKCEILSMLYMLMILFKNQMSICEAGYFFSC